MLEKSKIIKKIIFCFLLLGFVTSDVLYQQIFGAVAPVDQDQDHGWAMLDSIRSFMQYPVTFYTISRGLMSRMHDGMTVRIKSLKTDFGSYYKLEKDSNGAWALKADTKDPKDPAAQFLVSISDKYITLTSETANGFLLASIPQTFDVTLVSDKDTSKTDSTLWELVEDSNAGDTLESCYLKNKATGGLLTASYDSSGGNLQGQADDLQKQIKALEAQTPYFDLVEVRTEGCHPPSFDGDLSEDITGKVKACIHPDANGINSVLDIPAGDWVSEMSGINGSRMKAARFFTSIGSMNDPRSVRIQFKEGDGVVQQKIFEKIEGNALHFQADVTKHPAWPLRMKVQALEKQSTAMSGLKNSDIGRTGYGPTPFDINQWSKVAIEPVVDIVADLGEDSNTSKDEVVLAAAQQGGFVTKDLTQDKIWMHQNPEFEGSFQESKDFGPGQVITVNPLCSKGFAWLSQTFQTAGYGTVTFRAFTQESDIQVCFSDAVVPHAIYRIVFGASANTKTVIYKNDVSVQEITNDQSARARITPGKIEGFWVSLNNGFIIIGKGDPGTNIIMAWQDPAPPANVNQIGFSTYKSVVKYTDVQIIDNPVVVVVPTKSYVISTGPIQAGTVTAPAWYRLPSSSTDLPLSPADVGTVVFQATGSVEATLILANDKNAGYAITFGSDGNTTTKIVALENQQELYKIDTKATPLAGLDAGSTNKFWVSFYKGLIILGKGDVGKNTFCIYVDSNIDSNGNSTVPEGIFKIGFAGTATLQNLEIWPEVTLGFDQNVAQFVKQHQTTQAQSKLNIISPFDYDIEQNGPMIIFRNRITNMITNIAGTPSPLLVYHFTLDIGADGCPNLITGTNAPTPAKIVLETAVKVLQAAQDTVFNQTMMQAYEASQENDPIEGWITGPIMLLEASAMGAGGAVIAATQAGIQSKLDAMNALANRQINTEKVIRTAGGSTAVTDDAKRNQQQFEAALQAIFGPLPNNPNDPNTPAKRDAAGQLDYKTGLWDGAMRLITDSYVVGDTDAKKTENKNSISSGLSGLYNGVMALGLSADTAFLYTRIMNILIMAYNNAYLTSYGDLFDDQNRANWYLWINNLAKQFFSSQDFMKKGVDINFKGEYLWFPISFSQSGSGSLTFEVQAAGDVFVCFSENAVQTSDALKHIYEIVFGAWNNKLTVIRRENLGDDVVEFDNGKIPDLCPDPMTFKKYWINIDKGVLSGGVGNLGQNKLWEWADPYTPVPVKWIGFSNWLSAVTIRNVKVGGAIGKTVVMPKIKPAPVKP